MHERFQSARRIVDVLTDIEHPQLVLPAIQGEFVWSNVKICSLFDSLAPMGTAVVTLGHGVRTIREFLDLLQCSDVE